MDSSILTFDFSSVIRMYEDIQITIEMFERVKKYQRSLIDYMIYEPTKNHKSYRDNKLIYEIKNCETWMKRYERKLEH